MGLMAVQLASTNPAEAERLWNEVKGTVYKREPGGLLETCLIRTPPGHTGSPTRLLPSGET